MNFPAAYDLKEYYLTPQGNAVAAMLMRRIRAWWPTAEIKGEIMFGAGYTLPYLNAINGPRKTFAVLSGQMGAVVWPVGGPQRCVLAERGHWPIPAASVDYIVMVHDLEYAEDPAAALEEAWRVLRPEGKLMLVVPNRTGLWARAEKTPFGHGRPFTHTQLHTLLRDGNFALERMTGALLAPPIQHRMWAEKVAPVLEYLAPFCSALCGVTVAEASKRLYAPIKGKPKPIAKTAPVWAGESVPAPHGP
ncbi:MAG: methyltransferase domain-containing protein [Alphaproteobacteria bacterium]|nr:methyltransferase domain-containing protein [Alphaproteobacteria bacterium]